MNIHTYVYRDSGSSPWGLYQCPKLGQVFHISRIRNEKEQTLLEALSTGGQKGTTTSKFYLHERTTLVIPSRTHNRGSVAHAAPKSLPKAYLLHRSGWSSIICTARNV
jgi:hypothetical protein